MPVKRSKIRGRAAKQKGSRAEIKVRNLLRGIYPQKYRERVYRVPLSGAGAIKCDVMDMNDPDSAYEVKCQETLVLHDWWRQAKSQAGASRTPILVVTQSYRPFYFLMRKNDWDATKNSTIYVGFDGTVPLSSTRDFMDKIASIGDKEVATITLDDDEVVVVSQEFYLQVKACQAEDKYGRIDTES